MEFPSKLLEQIGRITRPKIEEHMLIVLDKSTHEEHVFQPLQTNSKQFKIAVTFLTAYNGFFKVTNGNNNFYFKKTITNEDSFIKITKPPGAYEIESKDNEIKRIFIHEGHYSGNEYSFTIKPNFSTLGYIIQIQPQGPIISFMFDDNIRDPLGFNARTIYEEYKLSENPVDVLSFDNIFLECDIAQGMIFKGKRFGLLHNFTKDVHPGYKINAKFRGIIQWYMMQSKDIFSSICFELKIENNQILSFNSQSITFRLSIKEF